MDVMKSKIDLLRFENPILVQKIIERQMKRQPELFLNSMGMQRGIADATYNLEYLFSAIATNSIILFEHYSRWVSKLFTNLNFPVDTLENFYDCAREIFRERFEQGLLEKELLVVINEYLTNGTKALKTEKIEALAYYKKDNPFQEILNNYSNFILAGDRSSAVQLIKDLSRSRIEIRDIYKYILQPFQIELGNLWHENKISVAQEHYATAVSQVAMSMLYEKIFATPRKGKTLLGACIQGELHEFGIRMVCDYMESCGWDTYYLGANMPDEGILQMIDEKCPDVVAISCTMIFNLSQLQNLVQRIKNSQTNIPVIVGGYPFNLDKDLWQKIGADAYSSDFEETYLLTEKVTGD